MELFHLSSVQQNLLIASVIGDGEITKITYKNCRRKNNSYREHYGVAQQIYREWKVSFLPDLWYMRPNSQSIYSKSLPIFTEMYSHFYDPNGNKKIPERLLFLCNQLHFLAVLYMDDGSLSISRSINHRKKRIFLTPHIFLYLQNYPRDQLVVLNNHFKETMNTEFSINKRPDGHGYILRFTSTDKTYQFLKLIQPVTKTCPSMNYKTNWEYRLEVERKKYEKEFPGYQMLASSSDRYKNYSSEEIITLIKLKKGGLTDRKIAQTLGRTYWSVVYKLRELRKNGLL